MVDDLDRAIYDVAIEAGVHHWLVCTICETTFVDKTDCEVHYRREHLGRGPGLTDFQSGDGYMRRRHRIFAELDQETLIRDLQELQHELATEP